MEERIIRIYLTERNFKVTYLHYEIDLDEYYLFINTKKNNRTIKKLCKKVKNIIRQEKNIDRNTKLIFIPIHERHYKKGEERDF